MEEERDVVRRIRVSARRVVRTESSSAGGSGSPRRRKAASPPCWRSQAKGAFAAARIATTDSTISGPMPSPGTRVVGMLRVFMRSVPGVGAAAPIVGQAPGGPAFGPVAVTRNSRQTREL
jgi:hypothetical protein